MRAQAISILGATIPVFETEEYPDSMYLHVSNLVYEAATLCENDTFESLHVHVISALEGFVAWSNVRTLSDKMKSGLKLLLDANRNVLARTHEHKALFVNSFLTS